MQLSLRIMVVLNTLVWMAEAQYEGEVFGPFVPQDGQPDVVVHMAARNVPWQMQLLFCVGVSSLEVCKAHLAQMCARLFVDVLRHSPGTRSGIWSAWFPLWFVLSDWAGHPVGFHCVFRQSWDLGHGLYGTALLSRDGHVPLPVVWSTHFGWYFSLRPCSRMFPQLALPAITGAFQRPTASTEGGWTCDSPTVFFNIDYLLIIYRFFLYN